MKRKSNSGQIENPYFLRNKRARTDNYEEDIRRCRKTKVHFYQLPKEIAIKVLRYIPLDELSRNVRLVSRHFRNLTQDTLNLAFKDIERKLKEIDQSISIALNYSEDDMETKCLCKLLNSIEYLKLHYTIAQSTIWRYCSNIYTKSSNLCMYAGSLLDLYFKLINQYAKEPHKIYSPSILNDHSFAGDILKVGHYTKLFVLYFDRMSEEPKNNSVFHSGCKILDILDCATECKKTVTTFEILANQLEYSVSYYFSNSWMVALDIHDDAKPWNERMRLMYMRLRRIVVSHSELQMEYSQYRREINLTPKSRQRVKRPINSVYTGYGEVGDTFFYYGAMNEGAYANKFETNTHQPLAVEGTQRRSLQEERQRSSPSKDSKYLGLTISVELSCPLYLAPLSILRNNLDPDANLASTMDQEEQVFDMKIKFHYPGAVYPRLPTNYTFELKGIR